VQYNKLYTFYQYNYIIMLYIFRMKYKLISFFKNTFIFLPLIYIAFSFTGKNNNSLVLEVLYGAPFILFGIYFLIKKNSSLVLLSLLYLAHFLYDYFNGHLTNNTGVIYLYREICLIYDFLVGVFLLYCSYSNKS